MPLNVRKTVCQLEKDLKTPVLQSLAKPVSLKQCYNEYKKVINEYVMNKWVTNPVFGQFCVIHSISLIMMQCFYTENIFDCAPKVFHLGAHVLKQKKG